jgi:outer membrane lipoprotein-sorting protein
VTLPSRRILYAVAFGLTAFLAPVALIVFTGVDDAPPPLAITRPEDTLTGEASVIRPGPLQSYYLEASLKPLDQPNATLYTALRGWFQAPDRTRWEINSTDPAQSKYVRILLNAGDEVWAYEPISNFYTHEVSEGLGDRLGGEPYPFPSSFQVGAVDRETIAAAAKSTRQDVFMGRPIDVYSIDTGEGEAEVWIDREYDLALRHLSRAGNASGASVELRVEKLQINPRLDKAHFVFVPPPDAREISPELVNSSQSSAGRPLNIPTLFLVPSYLPAGFGLRTSLQSNAGGFVSYIERNLANGSGDTLTITEQYPPGGMPEVMQVGAPIRVRAETGYSIRGGGERTIIFYTHDVIVTLKTNSLSQEELLKIAEGMRP